jgi:hypothetical protein
MFRRHFTTDAPCGPARVSLALMARAGSIFDSDEEKSVGQDS